jgi:hypothetical protein
MKKISCLALLSALVMPAFAEEPVAPVDTNAVVSEQNESPVVEEVAKQFEAPVAKLEKSSNPQTRFPHGLQLGLGVSPTSGLNVFVGYNNKKFDSFWAKRFGVRLDFATYSPIKNKLNSGINDAIGDDGLKISENVKLKDFELNAKHYGVLVDFYPFGDTWFLGGWRLSGGYMSGKLDLSAGFLGYEKFGKTGFCVNDYFYYYSDNQLRGRAKASWKYSGPYLGTGFDLGIFAGFKLYMDAGVVFAGNTPNLDVNIPLDGLKRTGPDTNMKEESVKDNPKVRAFFEENKEAALKEARDKVKDYEYYPMVKLGFMYRF